MITNTDFVHLPSGGDDSAPSNPGPSLGPVYSDKRCPECGDTAFDHDDIRAEISCMNCGLVLSGPPAWVAGQIKIVYPWKYTFEAEMRDQHGRLGVLYQE